MKTLSFLFLGVLGLAAHAAADAAPRRRTFTSPDRVFRFTYPASLILCEKAVSKKCPATYMPICDETAAACVAYRAGAYQGYNFEGAGFSVNVLRQSHAESECLESTRSTAQSELINGVKFRSDHRTSAGMGHGLSESSYRAFHRGQCYELDVRIATSSLGAQTPGAIKEFTSEDERAVKADFDAVLSSFKFLK